MISRGLICLLLFPIAACSQKENDSEALAVEGYDLVSYFNSKPMKGTAKYRFDLNGISYDFANSTNRDIFSKNPKKYLPQYGGWCAYAMGFDGSKVEINPASYKVIDGKLYLFYKTILVDTKSKWDKNEDSLMKQADLNWKNE